MTKFTENLWSDLAREHGPTLAHADRPQPGRAGGAGLLRRPRVLAGSTLGLAGVGTALVLVLSAGGAAAPPAFAITNNSDGSLTVNLDSPGEGLVGTNRKLAAMGTNEHIWFQMARGPAAVSGPVNCVPAPKGASVSGPPVKLTVGPGVTNTENIAAGNTGAGTWHVAGCSRFNGTDTAGIPVATGSLTATTIGNTGAG